MRRLGCAIALTMCLSSMVQSQEDIVAEIQKTGTPPVIDGLGDDAVWAAATAHGTDEFFTVSGLDQDEDNDLNVTWKALWDDENFYLFVEVEDNQIFNDEECNWDDDGIEVYLDAQNIDSVDFQPAANDLPPDGAPAYQLTAIAGDRSGCGITYSDDPDDHPSPFSTGINSYAHDDETAQFPHESDTGTSLIIDDTHYTLEVQFPWEAIEGNPAEIQANELGMGFTIAVNDDDDPDEFEVGGARDSQFAWETEANTFWMRSDVFPQIQLSNETVGGGGGDPGDYDADGDLDAIDVNTLAAAIRGGDMDSKFDLNSSGAVDGADLKHWVNELKNTWIGDANLDGEFSSTDFVAIFEAGLFEQDVDAGWETGDWNGDGRFGSGDLVAAFQEGGFEQGPRAAVASVPEPTGIVLPLLLVGMVIRRRRK